MEIDLDYFSTGYQLYMHHEWKSGGVIQALPISPFMFYHYTTHDPSNFEKNQVHPTSFWCSVKTNDRLAVDMATGIGHYRNQPMWRVELPLHSVAEGTGLDIMLGEMRWPDNTPFGPAHEYEIRKPVPLSICTVVPI